MCTYTHTRGWVDGEQMCYYGGRAEGLRLFFEKEQIRKPKMEPTPHIRDGTDLIDSVGDYSGIFHTTM